MCKVEEVGLKPVLVLSSHSREPVSIVVEAGVSETGGHESGTALKGRHCQSWVPSVPCSIHCRLQEHHKPVAAFMFSVHLTKGGEIQHDESTKAVHSEPGSQDP